MTPVILSICIPTYNRSAHLANCLNSIASNGINEIPGVQICVSDNGSSDDTANVVRDAARNFPIAYQRNQTNLGFARNLVKVVEMADGEFVWVIGDDDLLMCGAVRTVMSLLNEHRDTDYFFVNSNHLAAEYVMSYPQPFDVANLPTAMIPFSPKQTSGEIDFLGLISPEVSFDFLGGIFLSVFRRDTWLAKVHILNQAAIVDSRQFSHFDNTFPQITIFACAFANSRAYFHAKPVSVCLLGVREWGRMSAFIKSVRIVEALREYRRNGLPLLQYVHCRNFALNSFGPDFVKMVFDRRGSGLQYISPLPVIASHLIYPNFYLSFVYPLFRRTFWRKLRRLLSAQSQPSPAELRRTPRDH